SDPSTNRAAPEHTSMWVRIPAALPWASRSKPSTPPSSAASISRSATRTACSTSVRSENSLTSVARITWKMSIVRYPLGGRSHCVLVPVCPRRHGSPGHRPARADDLPPHQAAPGRPRRCPPDLLAQQLQTLGLLRQQAALALAQIPRTPLDATPAQGLQPLTTQAGTPPACQGRLQCIGAGANDRLAGLRLLAARQRGGGQIRPRRGSPSCLGGP